MRTISGRKKDVRVMLAGLAEAWRSAKVAQTQRSGHNADAGMADEVVAKQADDRKTPSRIESLSKSDGGQALFASARAAAAAESVHESRYRGQTRSKDMM